jgi:hypothetical protein
LMYYAVEIDSPLFLSGSLGGFSGVFPPFSPFFRLPRCGYMLSIYS